MLPSSRCPVRRCRDTLAETLAAGRILHPDARRRAERLHDLLTDIAGGLAAPAHLDQLFSLARALAAGRDRAGRAAARLMLTSLEADGRLFADHIASANCPSGDCDRITPAPCQIACPAGIDVASYVSLIGHGRPDEALALIRQDNPFPWVCGLICAHPCETACTRARLDRAVAIRELKAFAARSAWERHTFEATPVPCPVAPNGRRVAVIGAGPAGLAAAYNLALGGYAVRVFDRLPRAGGMMGVGIPAYRLPRDVLAADVEVIRQLGVEIHCGVTFGTDVTLESLRREGAEAVFLATGLHLSRGLNIPGEELPGVLTGVDFLRDVALGRSVGAGARTVVVGGGNVAIDVARSALRIGARDVTLVCLEKREEMPAWREEVHEALEEGVVVSNCFGPRAILADGGRVGGIEFTYCTSVFDDRHRFRPQYDECVLDIKDADTVIMAIGQAADVSFAAGQGIAVTPRGGLEADPTTLQTPIEWVFAGGDAVYGPRTVVEAIGAGKLAARSIDYFLQGRKLPRAALVPVRRRRTALLAATAERKMALVRPVPAGGSPALRRRTFDRLDADLTAAQACHEALRCLRCDVCKRCGTCAEVCRETLGRDALPFNRFDADETVPRHADLRITAERCVLCGACAEQCPTGALQLSAEDGECRLLFCGTELNRDRLVYCRACGAVLGAAAYLDHLRKQLQAVGGGTDDHLCPACRQHNAQRWRAVS